MALLKRGNIFWGKFEKTILEVIELAIDKFIDFGDFPLNEDELNRRFYLFLVSANYQLQKQNKGLESPPFYEGNNQPSPDDKQRSAREFKRPDFQWSITDVFEPSPERSSKQFVLECKRLGQPLGSWILNKNYVQHGIKRFIEADYGYGYGVESSAMLGYIQNMNITSILDEVNKEVEAIQQNLVGNQIKKSNHTQLSHKIIKGFPLKTIELKHIWVKIDGN